MVEFNKTTWILLLLIAAVIVFMFLINPINKYNEGYRNRPFHPTELYDSAKPWAPGATFVIHPDDAAFYYSTTNFPAYLCDEKQRYCYN